MTQETKDQSKELVGYQWNTGCDIGSGRQLSITGTFLKGASVAEMNKEFDNILSVLNRLQAKAAIVAIEQEIIQYQTTKANMEEDFARIEARYEAKGGPSTQEKSQREMALLNIATVKKNIAVKEALLEQTRKEAK